MDEAEQLIINCPVYDNLREQYGIGLNIRDALSNDPNRAKIPLDSKIQVITNPHRTLQRTMTHDNGRTTALDPTQPTI